MKRRVEFLKAVEELAAFGGVEPADLGELRRNGVEASLQPFLPEWRDGAAPRPVGRRQHDEVGALELTVEAGDGLPRDAEPAREFGTVDARPFVKHPQDLELSVGDPGAVEGVVEAALNVS